MSIAPGTRLGPYEVTALIGEGGMGRVYRATDTDLKRAVAIKVLPEAFASDTERLARFQREAEILAALNHLNIAHVHGLERSEGTVALVMELVEGPTLADRIAQGPISLDDALPIARQIAEALEAAHEQGIIHRDLKPANIKVRPDGIVKVLDFGLAKAMEPTGAMSASVSMSPTITTPAMTQAGMILGTAAYMAPEQARGKPADKRSDIWAFGCVLYELLTGMRAFTGDDVTDTIVSVVSKEPAWEALPTDPRITTLIRRCLKKDPKARMRDIGEARLQIDEILSGAPPEAAAKAPPALRRATREWPWQLAAGTGIAAIAVAATWLAVRPTPPTPVTPTRFAIVPPPSQPLQLLGTDRDIAISPDGTSIVYRAGTVGAQLVIRRSDRLDAQALAGIEFRDAANPRSPFFSPDGRWIGYFAGSELRKVSVSGGPPIVICRFTTAPRGASWGDDNTIVFATADLGTGLLSVSANGGEPKVLTKPELPVQEGDHYFPAVLPNRRGVLFTVAPPGTVARIESSYIAVYDPATGRQKTLLRGASVAEYVEIETSSRRFPWSRSTRDGYLIYNAGGMLHAVRFDLDRLETIGDGVPIGERVAMGVSGAANFAVSRAGTLVYVPGSGAAAAPQRSLVWVDRGGREEPLGAPPRAYMIPRLSPDGTRIALDIRDQENDIWVWDLERHTLTRLTFDPGSDSDPVWTPDSRQIIFSSTRGGKANLYAQAADGTGTVQRLTTSDKQQFASSITPDGQALIGYEVESSGPDVVLFRLAAAGPGRRQVEPLVHTSFVEVLPELSSDGKYIAYMSTESGTFEIYVRPFPNVDSGRWQIATGGGGTRQVWARNGRELFFLDRTSALSSVRVETRGPSFTSGNPSRLLEPRYFALPGPRPFDISADGERFLMIKDAPPSGDKDAPAGLIVVERWVDELKARLTSQD